MGVRSIERLRDEQREMLDAFRAERAASAAAAGSGPDAAGTVLRLAQVTEVVSSHPTLGPHLVAVLQKLSGAPPAASNLSSAEGVLYPTPNHGVGDYSVDEYVAAWSVGGVELALRLA